MARQKITQGLLNSVIQEVISFVQCSSVCYMSWDYNVTFLVPVVCSSQSLKSALFGQTMQTRVKVVLWVFNRNAVIVCLLNLFVCFWSFLLSCKWEVLEFAGSKQKKHLWLAWYWETGVYNSFLIKTSAVSPLFNPSPSSLRLTHWWVWLSAKVGFKLWSWFFFSFFIIILKCIILQTLECNMQQYTWLDYLKPKSELTIRILMCFASPFINIHVDEIEKLYQLNCPFIQQQTTVNLQGNKWLLWCNSLKTISDILLINSVSGEIEVSHREVVTLTRAVLQ